MTCFLVNEYHEIFIYFFSIEHGSFKKKFSTVQAQIDETDGDGVQEVVGGTKLRLWTELHGVVHVVEFMIQ